jgi:uncharacterized protein
MLDTSNWRSIDPKVKTLWRVGAAINALLFGGFAIFMDFVVVRKIWEETPIPPFVMPGVISLILLALGVGFADAKYRKFKFRIGEDDLALSQGIWWRTQRFVNRARIQHVDINTNFLSSRLGLSEIQVHVGAGMGAAITISGLRPGEAEDIRRVLLEGSMIRYREAAEAPPVVGEEPAAQPPPVSLPAAGLPPVTPPPHVGSPAPSETDPLASQEAPPPPVDPKSDERSSL